MDLDHYFKIGRANDIKNKKERVVFKLFEIFPGFLSWFTFILLFLISWKKPVWAAIFIMFFVIYFLLRNIYFSFHLKSCYQKMEENEKVDWIDKLNKISNSKIQIPIKNWREIYHLVIFPMYREPLEIVRESFRALVDCDYPKEKMIVILACEEKVREEVKKTAGAIEKEFGKKFFEFMVTWHPANLIGEIAGKGSNETWGERKAKEIIIDHLKIPYENIIVSSLDVDTYVFPKYFSCLTYYYLTQKSPTRCSFQPVPLFINNIWQAPSISRIFAFSASFWEMMCQERPEKLLTFSSHSMSFRALVGVDFKQTNVVSDDSRIFWQCFLKYNGDYQVVPLYYPISMDANVAPSLLKTIKNIYLQQRRWAYGVGDIPYFLFAFLKNKKIPLSKMIFPAIWVIEGHWSWATNSILIFFLGWLPLVLGGEAFNQTLLSYNLPIFTRNILTFAMIGLVASIYFSTLLLPPKPLEFGRKKYLFFAFEWLLVPIILIFFYALPAIDAQTRWMFGKYLGFWPTPKIRKSA